MLFKPKKIMTNTNIRTEEKNNASVPKEAIVLKHSSIYLTFGMLPCITDTFNFLIMTVGYNEAKNLYPKIRSAFNDARSTALVVVHEFENKCDLSAILG